MANKEESPLTEDSLISLFWSIAATIIVSVIAICITVYHVNAIGVK